MTTKRQHYIWRYYLRAWATDDHLYCKRDGKVFSTSLMGVGQENYFYKLHDLHANEIQTIITLGITSTQGLLCELHYKTIDTFTYPFRLRRLLQSLSLLTAEKQVIIGNMIKETEENYQGKIEQSGIKYLNLILNRDLTFYGDKKDRKEFLQYLCTQYMRTKKIRANVIKATSGQTIVKVEHIWPVLSHIYATNFAHILSDSTDFNLILLTNNTILPFITGDQPVLNTYASNKPLNEIAKELELYYPVSPKLAVLISKKQEYKDSTLVDINDIDKINSFNQYVIDESHEQLYSNTKDVLDSLI